MKRNLKRLISFLLIFLLFIPFLPTTLAETNETSRFDAEILDALDSHSPAPQMQRNTEPINLTALAEDPLFWDNINFPNDENSQSPADYSAGFSTRVEEDFPKFVIDDSALDEEFPLAQPLTPPEIIDFEPFDLNVALAELSDEELAELEKRTNNPNNRATAQSVSDTFRERIGEVNIDELNIASEDGIIEPNSDLITPFSADELVPTQEFGAPFSLDNNHSENINLNSGGLVYEHIDYVLPGINGLALTIGRRYDSDRASLFTPTTRMAVVGHTPVFHVDEIEEVWQLRPNGIWLVVESDLIRRIGPFDDALSAANVYFQLSNCGNSCHEHRITGLLGGEVGWRSVCLYFLGNDIAFARIVIMRQTGWREVRGAVSSGEPNNHLRDLYGLGVGWGFMFSSIESGRFLRLADGRSFEISGNTILNYTLQDLQLQGAGQFNNGVVTSSRTLLYKDGRREHFCNTGRLIGIQDRYNNTIRLVHDRLNNQPRIRITDTLGRLTTISSSPIVQGTRTVTVALPGSVNLRYIVESVNINVPNPVSFDYLWEYIDPENISTYYNVSLWGAAFNVRSKTTVDARNLILLLTAIGHPTGADTWYEWEPVDKNLGNEGIQTYFRVTAREERVGDAVFNRKQYTYSPNNNSGWPAHRNPANLPSGFAYQTTVTTPASGLNETHTFNNNHLTTSIATTHAGRNVLRVDFQYNNDRLPARIATRTFDNQNQNTFQDSIELFQYDNRGNITASWTPLANGNTANTEHRTTFTYDARFSELTNITYKQDVNTTIQTIFTLDSTGRHPLTETARVNNVQRNRTERTFSAQGNILTERRFIDGGTDIANSILTTFTYDRNAYLASIRVSGVRNALGANVPGTPSFAAGEIVTRFTYDTLGRMVSQTDPRGNTTHFEYNRRNDLEAIIHPDGQIRQFLYNYTQNIVVELNEALAGTWTQFTPLGQTWAVYDVFFDGEFGIMPGERIMAYDALNRLQSVTDNSVNSITSFTYDHLGRITSSITRRGNTTLAQESFAYAVVPNGLQRIAHTLHGDTNAPSIITTSYTNNMGFEVQTGVFLGGTEHLDTFQFDYLGNMTQSRTALDAQRGRTFTTRWEYNHLGLVTRETNTLNQSIAFTYDALGRNTGITDRAGNTTTFTYDNLDRLLTQSTPFEGTHRAVTRFTYDQAGNITREETQNNAPGSPATWTRTDYAYNSRNFLTDVRSFNGTTMVQHTEYIYFATGDIDTKRVGTPAAGYAVTLYDYDVFGNVTAIMDSLGQLEVFTYFPGGNWNLRTHTNRNGTTFTHTYDGLGRLINTAATASGRPSESRSTTYTLTGEIRSKTNPTGTTTFTYDALGRIIAQADPGNITKTYTYDIGGNRLSFVLRTGTTNRINTTYTYDNLNRLLTVREGGALQATYAYDINGNRATLTLANGVTTTYTYNLANLVTSLTNRRGSTTLSSYTYTYQLDGNQITKTDHNGRATTYTYDGLGRLVSETETGGANPSANETITYTYDTRSNRATMTRNGVTTTYTYDLNNRLLNTTTDGVTTNFTYDRNGNQLTEGSITNTYNLFNQLISSGETTFTYRPDGMRHSKTTNGITTIHLWDGSNIVADVVDGRITTYIRGIGLISSGDTFYLFDAHGSVVQLTDSSGEVTREYDYDAFGAERLPNFGDVDLDGYLTANDITQTRRYVAATDKPAFRLANPHLNFINADVDGNGFVNSSDVTVLRRWIAATDKTTVTLGMFRANDNPFRFAGEYFDVETGKIYLRARYYQPRLGRFTQPDPHWSVHNMVFGDDPQDPLGLGRYVPDILAIWQSGNLYVYCINNPIKWVDATGLLIWPGEIHRAVQIEIQRLHNVSIEVAVYRHNPTGGTRPDGFNTEWIRVGRADIVDTRTMEVWEVKPASARLNSALNQIRRYERRHIRDSFADGRTLRFGGARFAGTTQETGVRFTVENRIGDRYWVTFWHEAGNPQIIRYSFVQIRSNRILERLIESIPIIVPIPIPGRIPGLN